MSNFFEKKIWRLLAVVWGTLYLFVITMDFFLKDEYGYIIGPFSVLYIAVLSIFVGSKEFDRWHERHPGKKHGEIFVVAFSVLLVIFFILSIFLGPEHKVGSDVIATYVAILSVYVISQKSKELYGEKTKNQERLL
jgi:peptidoglycan/LPS O-acetylase OafA/YrhL